MVEEYIPILLPRNITASPSVRVIIREILACAVLCPVLLLVSESDFIFQQIDVHVSRLLLYPDSDADSIRGANSCVVQK